MAIITLSVTSPTEGFAWSVNFSVDGATAINNIDAFSITCSTNTGGNIAVPNTQVSQVVNGYSSDSVPPSLAGSGADSYVTWRSTPITGQYPVSGKSLDIWSVDFYNDIRVTSKSWSSMSASYALNPRKWSLIYDYSSRTAFVWSKGGTLTVSVV